MVIWPGESRARPSGGLGVGEATSFQQATATAGPRTTGRHERPAEVGDGGEDPGGQRSDRGGEGDAERPAEIALARLLPVRVVQGAPRTAATDPASADRFTGEGPHDTAGLLDAFHRFRGGVGIEVAAEYGGAFRGEYLGRGPPYSGPFR